MIYRVFSIFDSKIQAYSVPFFDQYKGAAIRSFTEAVNDSKNSLGKYPEDFTLFEIGSYDDSTASFVSHTAPISCGSGNEFVRPVV